MSKPHDDNGPRVLIVDDNRDIHDDIRKILDGSNSEASSALSAAESALFGDGDGATSQSDQTLPTYRFGHAYQGQEALKLVEDAVDAGDPYSVIFLDMRMPPGWDGIETLEHIAQVDHEVQVVFCTAFSDYSWEAMVERLGMSDRFLILRKPFDSAEIRQMANALAEKWRLSMIAKKQVEDLESEIERRMSELNVARDQAFQADKLAAVGQLAAGIAHEINTPIQYVGDNVRCLGEFFSDLREMVDLYRSFITDTNGDGDNDLPSLRARIAKQEADIDLDFLLDDTPAAIEQATEGVERVASIVRAMKEFSHINRNKITAIDINGALESTLTIAGNEYKYCADIERVYGDLDLVECIASEVNQVFLNLVVNAAHAIEDRGDGRGVLTVSTSQSNESVEIRIQDTGVGMPAEIRERIFEPFFTTKEVGRGSGQGLSIAYQTIVTRHHGEITVDSTPGVGTTFIIRLPKRFIDDANAEAPSEREAA